MEAWAWYQWVWAGMLFGLGGSIAGAILGACVALCWDWIAQKLERPTYTDEQDPLTP